MRDLPDPNRLRLLVDVAHHGSIAGEARANGITASAGQPAAHHPGARVRRPAARAAPPRRRVDRGGRDTDRARTRARRSCSTATPRRDRQGSTTTSPDACASGRSPRRRRQLVLLALTHLRRLITTSTRASRSPRCSPAFGRWSRPGPDRPGPGRRVRARRRWPRSRATRSSSSPTRPWVAHGGSGPVRAVRRDLRRCRRRPPWWRPHPPPRRTRAPLGRYACRQRRRLRVSVRWEIDDLQLLSTAWWRRARRSRSAAAGVDVDPTRPCTPRSPRGDAGGARCARPRARASATVRCSAPSTLRRCGRRPVRLGLIGRARSRSAGAHGAAATASGHPTRSRDVEPASLGDLDRTSSRCSS